MKTEDAMYMLVIVLSIALILSTAQSYSQTGEIQFEKISTESGLSQSSVLCICQDSKGFLWFGTYEGLNRCDGYTFKVYKNDFKKPSSLSNNSVMSIIVDHLGTLWIGTEGGLDRFDREKEKFIHYKNNPNDSNSLGTNYVRSVYEDRSGTLWVGTHGGGLNKFDRKEEKFIHYKYDPRNLKSLSQNNVLSILEDREGRLWIGTDSGLNYFDRKKGEFIRYQNDPHDPHSISHNSAWRIFEDRAGNLWIGTWGGGLNRFDPQKNWFIRYQNNSHDKNSLSNNIVRAIYEDHNGNLWLGTDGGGLDKFVAGSKIDGKYQFLHYKNNPQDPASLSGNSVLSIFEDKLGILWIGTDFNGIDKYNSRKSQFTLYRNHPNDVNSLGKNTVLAVCEDNQGMIWIGTTGGGLDCLDRKKNRFTHYVYDPKNPNSVSNNTIRNIFEDRHKRLWIGTDYGFNYFDRQTGKFLRYQYDPNNPHSISNNTAWSIYEDRKGNLWVGTFGAGLNRFDYANGKFTRYIHNQNDPKSLSDNFIWTMCEDSSGILWIGTLFGGLERFDPEKGTSFHYRPDSWDSNSISDNKVLCLLEDHAGAIWLGTTNGLNKFDRNTGTFHRYSESEGLPSNNIQGILEDDHGNLWIGTNHGLSKFDPRTIKFKNYFESSGLQNNEFGSNACCKLKSGEMIFGGMNGFNIFYPDSIHADTSRPSVVITDFQIFNKPVPIDGEIDGHTILQRSISECDEIHLSYKENVFSFEFAGLHYASPQGNLYAYMMEGFDKEWNYTDANRRFATYTNLPGKTYTFRVKASNNQGVWNDEGTSIRIIITPPFWKTMWFQSLGIFIGVLSIVTFYRIRTNTIRKRNKELEMKVEIRTQELADKKNLLQTVIDLVPDSIYVKDKNHRFILNNLAHISSLGAKKQEDIIGKTDIDFFPVDNVEEYHKDERLIMETGKPVINKEEKGINPLKSEVNWVLTSKVQFKNNQNELQGIVGISRLINERKRIEEEREKLIAELQEALADVKMLSGLVPICANCKKIRDDQGFWTQIESYIQDRSSAKFSHSICPDCAAKLYPNYNIKK